MIPRWPLLSTLTAQAPTSQANENSALSDTGLKRLVPSGPQAITQGSMG